MRFIEFMPLDAQGEWSNDKVVPAHEILERINAVFPLESSRATRTSNRRRASRYRDGIGDVGVIPSVTEPFCENCDRVRITAEGQFRTCLFALDETDLRADAARGRRARRTRPRRPPRRRDHGARSARSGPATASAQVDFVRPGRSMSQIGG